MPKVRLREAGEGVAGRSEDLSVIDALHMARTVIEGSET